MSLVPPGSCSQSEIKDDYTNNVLHRNRQEQVEASAQHRKP